MPNILQDGAATASGKLGSTKPAARLEGVFRQIANEHQEVATSLPSVASDADAGRRAQTWAKIRQDLTAHEHAELEIVYPEFEMHASLSDIVSEHEAEADNLEELIRNVDTALLDSAQWETCVRELHAAVVRHAHREEDDFFPRAQSVIGQRRAEELEELYSSAKLTLTQGV